jgi:hypothetical protein
VTRVRVRVKARVRNNTESPTARVTVGLGAWSVPEAITV